MVEMIRRNSLLSIIKIENYPPWIMTLNLSFKHRQYDVKRFVARNQFTMTLTCNYSVRICVERVISRTDATYLRLSV